VTEETCYANIGPRGARLRQIGGVVALGFGIALVAGLVWSGLPRTWRALAFVPFWLAALGFFQARDRTCVALAGRGLKDLDGGPEEVVDEAERAALSAQARAVRLRATAAAVALTTAVLLFP
jgi:hypothetical protein